MELREGGGVFNRKKLRWKKNVGFILIIMGSVVNKLLCIGGKYEHT